MLIARQRARKPLGLPRLIVLMLSLALCGCSLLPAAPTSTLAPTARLPSVESATPRQRATAPSAAQPTSLQAQPIGGFETIAPEQLPPEARQTLALIARGGPFPYRQDGQVFQNRERRLPRHPSGYYHEYTVETHGSDDRGARRIITGQGGELYYTEDHYRTFRRIRE